MLQLRMGDDAKTAQEAKRDEHGRFQPGHSLGRPKRGHSLAEITRRIAEPEKLVKFLIELVENPKAKHADRLAACAQLLDRGWGKPLQSSDVTLRNGDASEPGIDWSKLPVDKRREWLALLDAARSEQGDDNSEPPAEASP